MLVDKTNFGLVIYNHADFYRFEESSRYSIITLTLIGLRNHLDIGQLNEYQFFSAFHWSVSNTPPASQCITEQ